ncbi:MAG: SdrD B-like domain-containing protein [Candidatus Dojkabacteria bacterium]|nr:SdrD B-like domain-containing protein [Candidatus Dojkabacteria bacterium]
MRVSDITTSGNAWAGMALYSNGAYYAPEGSDSVTYSGIITMDEIVGLYIEPTTNPLAITNTLIAPGTGFSATTSTYILSLAATDGGNNVEALGVNWGTNILNDIEARIQHDCVDSPFPTANTCNGDDLAASFPSVNYIGNGVQGLVYRDVNLNGTFDAGDPRSLANRYSSWTVELRDDLGNLLDTTVSQSDGLYNFVNLADGDYMVCVPNPGAYIQTEPTSGPAGFENCEAFSVSGNSLEKDTKLVLLKLESYIKRSLFVMRHCLIIM